MHLGWPRRPVKLTPDSLIHLGKMEDLERQTIGRYEIEAEIGRGASGIVYAARDTQDDRQVALKVAHAKPGDDEKTRRRRYNAFMNEARTAGMLKHQNIIEIYGVGDKGGVTYMAMELVAGQRSLDQYCKPDRLLPMEEVVSIIIKCATALDFAHRNGVIHRDVKPKNVFLTEDGRVKIGDFGIALVTGYDAADTQDQAIPGSPLYMSPEQVSGNTLGAESDIFVLGVVLYEMLTGKHPFVAEVIPAISAAITHKAHVPADELRPEIPAALVKVVDRALKKHPAGRYQTGLDMAGDLGLVFDHIQLSDEDLSSRDHFDRVRDLSFFATFPEPEIWEVLNASHWQEFQLGEQLIEEGTFGDSFYILVEGELSVHKGEIPVDTLQAGACFGEIGFVTRKKRMASIVARTPVTVMEIRAGLIPRISMGCQLRFHKAFIDTMAERLLRAMEKSSRAS